MTGDLDPRHDQGERPVEPLLPEALAALTTAARQHGRARRRRWSPWRGAPLAVLVVFLTGTAVAATTQPWAGLFTSKNENHATIATSPIPSRQLEVFGVLRRAQTDADRTPGVRAALRRMYGYSTGQTDVHLEGVRVLERSDRELVLLVPVGRVGQYAGTGRPLRPPLMRDALCLVIASTDGPDLAAAVRQRRSGDDLPSIVPKHAIDDPAIDFEEVGVSAGCGTLADATRSLRVASERRSDGAVRGLARDGIVSVEATSHRGKTVVGTVRDNYFSIKIPTDEPGFRGVPIRGRTADGRLR